MSRPAILLVGVLAMLSASGCHRPHAAAPSGSPRLGAGDEWIASTQEERRRFVWGYIDGSAEQMGRVCEELYREDAVNSHTHAGLDDAWCRGKAAKYTKFEVGNPASMDSYVRVIDGFYTHAECRVIPITLLMEELGDDYFVSGDELYHRFRKGETHFGFLSGEPGTRDCLGVDRT